MNLSEMLSYADIGLLGAIAREYNCECSSNSKNELIQAILTALNSRDTFDHILQELTEPDLRLMNRLLFDQRQYFSLEELTAIVKQANRYHRNSTQTANAKDGAEQEQEFNPRETLLRLRNRGWLFNGHSRQTRYLYRIPEDVKRRFRECYTSYLSKQLTTIEHPVAYRDEQMIIGQDVLQFLRYIHQNEIPLTIDGAMYKRQLQQILSSLHVREETVRSRGWRFGYGRRFKDYPNRFSFIYDYCYYSGFIVEQANMLQLTSLGEERVRSGLREDPLEMYRLWLKLYKGPIPNLQALAYWICRLCERWTTVASLRQALCKMIQPYYYDQPEQILELRIIQMMMHLGLLQIGEDEDQGPVVRINELGSRIITGTYVPEDEWIDLETEVPLTWKE